MHPETWLDFPLPDEEDSFDGKLSVSDLPWICELFLVFEYEIDSLHSNH